MEGILGQNRVDDVSWLCSLSESELDMLISIKRIVLHRARMIGCDELAQKFDLKVLRALGMSDRRRKEQILALFGVALLVLFGKVWLHTSITYHIRDSVWFAWVFLVWDLIRPHYPETNIPPTCFGCLLMLPLAFVLMECVKDKVKDLAPPESAAFMGSCNLLKHNLGDIMSLEEIMACIGIDSRKGPIKSNADNNMPQETLLSLGSVLVVFICC
ncbi:hypothetical protein DVH24_011129 [Malus domestica]|uniref:Uncharacterized protein n=1 Tax=Malus domestica TaxID=3750 RepID=A0A498JYC8_MALDO|nr:hypothetical protein DVH24_011129 [Malus domestica]